MKATLPVNNTHTRHSPDPVLQEIREHKAAISARFGGDVRALLAALREQQAQDPSLVSRTKRADLSSTNTKS